jgi:hypothetical protein
MKMKPSILLFTNVLRWIFTILAMTLFARLVFSLFNLVFNFEGTPIGRLVNQGVFLERISDLNPYRIALQSGIVVAIVVVLVVLKWASRKGDNQSDIDNHVRS